MRKLTDSPSFLIAVELGGAWPEWLNQPSTGTRRVVSELEGEGPGTFAGRAAQELTQHALEIQGAVVLCNERTDAAQLEARRALVRSIFARAGKSATLTLAAPRHASERLRFALDALAVELGRRLTVRYDGEPLAATVISRVA